jgi:hypothetical protein
MPGCTGHPQPGIRRALIHLARQVQSMARRQGHLVDLADVPRRHDEAARVGVDSDPADHLVELVDRAPVGSLPLVPLLAVDRPRVRRYCSPIRPISSLRSLSGSECSPFRNQKESVDDAFQVALFRRDKREPFLEVKAHLVAEYAQHARAGTVRFSRAALKDVRQ